MLQLDYGLGFTTNLNIKQEYEEDSSQPLDLTYPSPLSMLFSFSIELQSSQLWIYLRLSPSLALIRLLFYYCPNNNNNSLLINV